MSQAGSGLNVFARQQPGSLFGSGGPFGGAQGGGSGQDFIRSLFANPLLAGSIATLLGGFKFGLPAALAASDLFQVERQNEQSQATLELLNEQLQFDREQTQAQADLVPNFFDPSSGQVFGPDAGFARQGLRGGFTQPGKLGAGISDNLITLPEFNVGQTALEGFQENLPSQEERTIGFDPIGLLQPNQLFSQLEGLGVLPETDLSEVLGARLGGIQAAGTGREQQRLQEVAALAPQFGGLENLRGAFGATSAQEGAFRGLESQGVVGQTRLEELDAQKFVSEVAGNLGAEEARLNAAIQQFNRGSQFTTQNTNISRELALAQTLSSLEAGAANDPIQRTSFLTDAINRSLGLESNLFGASTTNTLNQLAAQIPLLQQNTALANTFLQAITPGRFAGVSSGGGGDQFSIDLASAAGIGLGAAGLAGGVGGGAAAGGGLSSLLAGFGFAI